jgi:hypothetical protein
MGEVAGEVVEVVGKVDRCAHRNIISSLHHDAEAR